jgi:aldose 1-epimerase
MASPSSPADDAPFSFLPLGAIIQTFLVPVSASSSTSTATPRTTPSPPPLLYNIVQSFPSQALYEAHNAPYFGETIGRVAGRINNATIGPHWLAGGTHKLDSKNEHGHTLHGGVKGWGKRVWDGPKPAGVVDLRKDWGVDDEIVDGGESVVFSLLSEDGDEGFPGTVRATVRYIGAIGKSTRPTDRSKGREVRLLGIEYEAELVNDDDNAYETCISMTNHSYFNLSDRPTIDGTVLSLASHTILPMDEASIPTGAPPTPHPLEIRANEPIELGVTKPDFDEHFIVTNPDGSVPDPSDVPIDTRSRPLTTIARASHPDTGIHLEVLTTEPSFQVYTGRYVDVPETTAEDGTKVPARGKRAGFCIEPSRYINAVNVPEFRDMVVLKQGEKYGARILYRAWSE